MASSTIPPPDIRAILAPLLPSLPAAAVSSRPHPSVLPLLSPILRQRVQLLSSSSSDPWIRLLSYDTAKAAKLPAVIQTDRLEPHPASGEIEIDWDSEAEVQYRRLDTETLQAFVVLQDPDLFFRLVHCVGDKDGGGDGWRVGEVSVADRPSPFASFDGKATIAEAERSFEERDSRPASNGSGQLNGGGGGQYGGGAAEEEDDDDYWARYDATPARTPAAKRSPAPASAQASRYDAHPNGAAEDAYYAQYDDVQPAMDPHDPDEEAEHVDAPPPPLGLAHPTATRGGAGPADRAADAGATETGEPWTLAPSPSARSQEEEERTARLAHPRPRSASPASSSGSVTVAKLEEKAGRQEQSEFGVRRHVARSIRSLFLLSRAAGIDREEFESLVKTELDVLGMVEDDI